MTLISVLLAIAADRLLGQQHDYRNYRYFLDYADWMRVHMSGRLGHEMAELLLVLAPLWLVVGLGQYWISDWLLGLIGLLFYAAVLLYCLGPRDLAVDVDSWCDACDAGDRSLRQLAAGRLLGGEETLREASEHRRQIADAVLVSANDRLFAVLFWFVLLGPVGAVLYRSVSVLYQDRHRRQPFEDSLTWLYSTLIWLPARLVAVGYALSGHFDAAIDGWRRPGHDHLRGVEASERLLAATGSGALGAVESEGDASAAQSEARAAMRLVWRTLTIWLVVIALLTLAGWAG